MDLEDDELNFGPLVRSPDVWFDDGTVVLQAETTLFRVYRGVLAAQSPIFRDTFAIPQPPTQDTYEGCLLIVLHDSPDDLKEFLLAIHDAGYFFNHPVSGIETLSAMLRLSTKYDVEHIRSRMISILTTLYPSSISAFLNRKPPAGYVEMDEDDFIALKLALCCDILVVVPAILYECCRYPATALLSADISLADKKKCVDAVQSFMDNTCRTAHSFLFEGPATCTDSLRCDRHRLRWIRHNGLPQFRKIFARDFSWNSIKLCENCTAVGKEHFSVQRAAVWDSLPDIFDLPSWEVLKAQQGHA
ncbi:hypothetical protein C8R44DRAFT_715631 [Mycena epipterygia]|nr:hypothetical protein C8R44DRAFT_715631 [Mycena epipterygia]